MNFHHANLRGADLRDADLAGATFQGAIDLRLADLRGATLRDLSWQMPGGDHEPKFRLANLFGVVDAPSAFLEAARADGAVEMADEDEWSRARNEQP